MNRSDRRIETSFSSFESTAGTEAIFEVATGESRSEKPKMAREGSAVWVSIVDRISEIYMKDIKTGDGVRRINSQRLLKSEIKAMERTEMSSNPFETCVQLEDDAIADFLRNICP
jgi:hypothetical protein